MLPPQGLQLLLRESRLSGPLGARGLGTIQHHAQLRRRKPDRGRILTSFGALRLRGQRVHHRLHGPFLERHLR